MRPDIEDTICLTIPTGPETTERRWWEIRQPPPSIAFSLQGHLTQALGPGVYDAILDLLRVSEKQIAAQRAAQEDEDEDEPLPPREDPREDYADNVQTLGEAEALKIYRRARMGASLVDPGEPLETASERLRIALSFVARRTGVSLGTALLLGESERDTDRASGIAHRWAKPSLLHRLLLASELKFGGTAKVQRFPSGAAGDDAPGAALWSAVQRGSIQGFVKALDEILISADELAMLATWSVIHLFRPF